jgi:predicted dinucleotide-binding enzyme
MSYAIIGFGNVGQALAKAFARKGIEVSVATLLEGGLLVQARGNSWGQLIFKDLVKFD